MDAEGSHVMPGVFAPPGRARTRNFNTYILNTTTITGSSLN